MPPPRIEPGPGQESAWDYPRPPRVEPSDRRVVVEVGGVTIGDSTRALRVLETSHPPVWYVPPDDVDVSHLERAITRTFCEYKGSAEHWSVVVGDRTVVDAAWSYPSASAGYEVLAGHLAFYPARVDACFVDGERVTPQPGGFYGGWITADVVGPFKGGPGTMGW
jgi:uncharacterized protein (DUF427 family)